MLVSALISAIMALSPDVATQEATAYATIFARETAKPIRVMGAEVVVDPFLAVALCRRESRFKPDVESPAGAVGLCQVMPGNFIAGKDLTREKLLDPKKNIRAAVRYLAYCLWKRGGNLHAALNMYNGRRQRSPSVFSVSVLTIERSIKHLRPEV